MIDGTLRQGTWARRALGLAALVTVAAVTGWATATVTASNRTPVEVSKVRAVLKLRLPKTPVDRLTCTGLGSLCEVASGTTLFYVDPRARYLVIGRVYDMETRQDLTAARLLELNPDLLATGAARNPGAAEPRPTSPPQKIDPTALPASGAIHWGPANGPKAIVFSDFQCGYCQKLTRELNFIGASVEERPISIFGKASRHIAEKVLCARDPASALHRAYEGRPVAPAPRCDTKGLDANEAFAKAHGFTGTPVIVRPSDGTVLQGYRDAATLRAFLTATKD